MEQIVGYIAGSLCTVCTIPQVFKALKTKKANDVSYIFLILLIAGLILWILYGVLISQVPVIISNSVCLAFNIILISIKSYQDCTSKNTMSKDIHENLQSPELA